jgi:hypothetical protein
MGMTKGGETITFEADNDEAAKEFIIQNTGADLSMIKRDVEFKKSTLARVLD